MLAFIEAATRELNKLNHSRLTNDDQFGSTFDMLEMCMALERIMAITDVRLRVGSEDEKAALAEILDQLRYVMTAAPTLTRLAEAAGSAVKLDRSKEAARRAAGATRNMIAAAEKVRDLVEATPRNPNDPSRPLDPGATWVAMREILGDDIDEKTARGYWNYCIDNPRSCLTNA